MDEIIQWKGVIRDKMTYHTVPPVYSAAGIISSPFSLIALDTVHVARTVAIVIQSRASARCCPGHILHVTTSDQLASYMIAEGGARDVQTCDRNRRMYGSDQGHWDYHPGNAQE